MTKGLDCYDCDIWGHNCVIENRGPKSHNCNTGETFSKIQLSQDLIRIIIRILLDLILTPGL